MNNEEVLTAFGEYVESHLFGFTTIPNALSILREFATAIDPVPLTETTLQEIRVFEREHKIPVTPMKPLPLSAVEIEKRHAKVMAELRYSEYRLVMEYFRAFRREVLR